MEQLSIKVIDGRCEIHDVPGAVKFVVPTGPLAKRMAEIALHLYDLTFSLDCLDEFKAAPEGASIVREALWQSAIVNFLKCFLDSDARGSLKPLKFYDGDRRALEAYDYFKNLRNKHIASFILTDRLYTSEPSLGFSAL